jgi:rare lipoprotein A
MKRFTRLRTPGIALVVALCSIVGCANTHEPPPAAWIETSSANENTGPAAPRPAAPEAIRESKPGKASYYGKWHHGRKTASGERFNKNEMTAAHRTLPMGTLVRVTNTKNDRSVIVRINDRGPYRKGRVIDVSHAAATQLGMVRGGIVPVRLEVVAETRDVAHSSDPT